MSQILRDLNKLAEKMGAPIVGRNISEQVRAISTYYDGTSHGANIAERINEVAHSNIGSGSAVLISKTINRNGNYSATDDEADGYSDVKVNVSVPTPTLITKNITANGTYDASGDSADGYSSVSVNVKTKWLKSHGSEYIVIPANDFTKHVDLTLVMNFYIYDIGSGDVWTPLFGSCVANCNRDFSIMHNPGYQSGTLTAHYYESWDDRAIGNANMTKPSTAILGWGVATVINEDGTIPLRFKSNSSESESSFANHDIGIFCRMMGNLGSQTPSQYGIKMCVSNVKMYDSTGLIFSGTPAIDPTTGKAGLYDSVNNKYYGNVNTSSATDFEIVEED